MGKRAVICGYYGKGNGGDEALLVSLLQMLPEQVTPIVLSGNPSQTSDRYGVESGDRFSPFSVLKALRHSDCFIWGGGSLIQDLELLGVKVLGVDFDPELVNFWRSQGILTFYGDAEDPELRFEPSWRQRLHRSLRFGFLFQ